MPVVAKANRSDRHPTLSQRLQQIIAQPSERNASWNLAGFTHSGLPIGLQITGAPFAESTVLVLAHAYEQATEWHTSHPMLSTA